MYKIVGKITGTRLNISAVHNLDYVSEHKIITQEDEVTKIVEPFEFTPPNPDPSMSYTPYYNLITSKIEYDETLIPEPEPTDEQRKIASLETELTDTQLALVELFESMGV